MNFWTFDCLFYLISEFIDKRTFILLFNLKYGVGGSISREFMLSKFIGMLILQKKCTNFVSLEKKSMHSPFFYPALRLQKSFGGLS